MKTENQYDPLIEGTPASASPPRSSRRRGAKTTARKDAAAKATTRARKSAPVPKVGPHPQIAEAQKALDAAKEAYVYAVRAIEGQYVKALVGAGEIAGVNALRGAYRTLPELRYERTSGLHQPAAPRAAKKTVRAKTKTKQ